MTLCLVTGGGGFLGRYIVEQLRDRGDQVRSLSRNEYSELSELGVEQIRGDVQDRDLVIEACRDVDVVFHTAAIAGIWGPWVTFYGINTVGTRNVLAGCLAHGVGRLVYSSSPSVTFDGSEQCGIDESATYPERWLCHYPHSKAIAEREVLAADGSQGLRTCALRPHLIWGPRDQHLIPRLLARARAGKLRIVGDGSNMVDMVYVENAAEAHLLAADALAQGASPVGGSAYFISQGEPVNCWQWINEILQTHGAPIVRKSISYPTAHRIGAALEAFYRLFGMTSEPRMTRFLAAQLAKSHYFDISRARDELGYSARISTAEGMRRLANSQTNG